MGRSSAGLQGATHEIRTYRSAPDRSAPTMTRSRRSCIDAAGRSCCVRRSSRRHRLRHSFSIATAAFRTTAMWCGCSSQRRRCCRSSHCASIATNAWLARGTKGTGTPSRQADSNASLASPSHVFATSNRFSGSIQGGSSRRSSTSDHSDSATQRGASRDTGRHRERDIVAERCGGAQDRAQPVS